MASLELQRHNQTVLDNLELGDMLEFKRGAYSQWAVYVGNEGVVHLSGADGAGGSDLKHPVTISGVKSDNCIVRKDNFWSVAGDSKAYKYNSKDTNKNICLETQFTNCIVKEQRKMTTLQQLQQHNQTVLDNLEPGDMLQFKRGVFSHWAVYVGDKEVVHLSGVDGPTQSGLFSSVSISGAQFDNGIIRKDAFWDVVGLSEVCQNNSKDEKLKYFEPSEIVQRALSKIGKVGYNILFNNCEHFATWCRYGKEESDQVQGLFDAVAEVGSAVVRGAGVALAALFGSGGKEEREKHTQNLSSYHKMVTSETEYVGQGNCGLVDEWTRSHDSMAEPF